MAGRHIEDLSDAMRARIFLLVAHCSGCAREARFSVVELVRFYGAGRPIRSLPFYCGKCGSRDIEYRFEKAPPRRPPAPTRPKPIP